MPSQADGAPSLIFVPEIEEPGARLALSPEESHYLTRVCRVRSGARVRATDGRGGIATLRVVSEGKELGVEVESIERLERTRQAHVWCGAPEGQRSDWLVEKLAELGIALWQPLQCERASWPERREERWRRLAIAALRQSRRAFMMEIRPPLLLNEALAAIPERSGRWLASPEGEPGWTPEGAETLSIGAIGPSTGFSPAEERSLRDAGFRAIRLSDGRLRSETAALAWAARWTV